MLCFSFEHLIWTTFELEQELTIPRLWRLKLKDDDHGSYQGLCTASDEFFLAAQASLDGTLFIHAQSSTMKCCKSTALSVDSTLTWKLKLTSGRLFWWEEWPWGALSKGWTDGRLPCQERSHRIVSPVKEAASRPKRSRSASSKPVTTRTGVSI